VVLIATGSSLARAGGRDVLAGGIDASVVSMPSWELFDEQDAEYRTSVLKAGVPRVSIEAGITWLVQVRGRRRRHRLDRFGMSRRVTLPWRSRLHVDSVVDTVAALLA